MRNGIPLTFSRIQMLPTEREWLCQEADGSIRLEGALPTAILPGSFNPLHEGHRQLAAVAARKLNAPVAFELSIRNVDKPELADAEVRRRLDQFLGLAPVYVTRAPTFDQKATLFPGTTFIVGSDTASRIVDARYYQDDVRTRDETLYRIGSHDCRFLVAGRSAKNGEFISLNGIMIPMSLASLFAAIEEHEFRMDVSSTMLRMAR